MKIRAYTREDSPVIAKWVRTEYELYQWSSDRFGFFPLLDYSVDENYIPQLEEGNFYPLTAVDDDGKIAGHLIIRYPDPDNRASVRFGFVIVDPDVRGKGYGHKMLLLALDHVRENLPLVTRVDLGVFENNPKAKRCYEAAGFKDCGEHLITTPYGDWRCIDMEQYL